MLLFPTILLTGPGSLGESDGLRRLFLRRRPASAQPEGALELGEWDEIGTHSQSNTRITVWKMFFSKKGGHLTKKAPGRSLAKSMFCIFCHCVPGCPYIYIYIIICAHSCAQPCGLFALVLPRSSVLRPRFHDHVARSRRPWGFGSAVSALGLDPLKAQGEAAWGPNTSACNVYRISAFSGTKVTQFVKTSSADGRTRSPYPRRLKSDLGV